MARRVPSIDAKPAKKNRTAAENLRSLIIPKPPLSDYAIPAWRCHGRLLARFRRQGIEGPYGPVVGDQILPGHALDILRGHPLDQRKVLVDGFPALGDSHRARSMAWKKRESWL